MRAKLLRLVRALAVAVVAFLVVGNLAITLAWQAAAHGAPDDRVRITGVENFEVVDDRLWRGAAPRRGTYEDLAASGVTTVIDLRAEEGLHVDEEALDRLGLDRVAIPLRDGQAPTAAEVARFLAAVEGSAGRVFVHCGAGVGRTGTMVAAYRVATRSSSALAAMRANLAVGPPSLEQLAFAAGLGEGVVTRPPVALVAASRVLDAPRRLWSRLRA